jgi:hypothetical protein
MKTIASSYLLPLFACLFPLLLLSSCELHVSDNGQLDGWWQLTQVDTLATNGSAPMKESKLFWAVQGRMLEMQNMEVGGPNVIFRFSLSHDTLRVWDPICDNRSISDSIVTDLTTLRPYGVLHLADTFRVEALTSDKMLLRNRAYRLHFRAY